MEFTQRRSTWQNQKFNQCDLVGGAELPQNSDRFGCDCALGAGALMETSIILSLWPLGWRNCHLSAPLIGLGETQEVSLRMADDAADVRCRNGLLRAILVICGFYRF